jgi:hypothetical protein
MTRRMKDDPVHGLNMAIAALLTHRECPLNSPEADTLKSAVEWFFQHPLESAAALIEEYMVTNAPAKDTCSHCGRTTFKSQQDHNTYLALDETVKKLRRFAALFQSTSPDRRRNQQ